jgi:serine/threonine protein kinase
LQHEASLLGSPYISKIEAAEFDESKNELKLLIELGICSLTDLAKIKASQKKEFTNDELSHIMDCALNGIKDLSEKGICHLDIKPDNFIVSAQDLLTIKLIDFGVS